MREAWSSPTRTAARPGVMPLSASARTRSATSARICAAVALPSRIRAVTQESYRRTPPGPRSVPEMTRASEHDRHAVPLGRPEDLLVSLGSAGVDHGRAAGLRGDLERVREREEGVARDDGALRPIAGLARGDPRGVDAGHLARADPDGRPVAGEDDRVGLHAPRDRPREQQVLPFVRGRLAR